MNWVLLRELIGRVLRQVRLDQSKTLREVADAAGVSVGHLSKVERGRKEPSSEVLAAICIALGPALPELLGAVLRELSTRRPRLKVRGGDFVLAA
ncbi:helix-turn-helix transcriptional regulator [Geodermatophilus sp. DSM 44513]|uniref:helix-turn-helix domain-containing protein n=1 Tax=Geodermatophilus sp. DSM 44513 TaxID=1528104 RepID=UPI0028F74083|nr:helix-turn-helix transcriptional regulator [Geodermatophilus sp. DSM 44513]WNV74269.1 helix-turn-helix transcriptional regulator [Geodermatophilus sp. DSM 44513]